MDAGEFDVRDGLVLTYWRNVFVNVWRGDATVERLRLLRSFRTEMKRRFPDGTATITVLDANQHSLTPEARAEASAIARDFDGKTLGVAHVLEGTGFGAAARRMILSGVLAMSHLRSMAKTFESISTAATWVVGRLGVSNDREHAIAELVAHIESARRAQR